MGRPHALMIIDTLDITSLDFRQTLDYAGYSTELVMDSHTTLDQIARCKPSLIFLYLDLPVLSGTVLFHDLQGDVRFKDIPVVALVSDRDVANQLLSLVDIVLLRPVDHERLTSLLSLLSSIAKPLDRTPWDALTGFYTPSYFIARLKQAIKNSHVNGSNDFIVFSIKLEHLVKYEQKFGTEYGQHILQGIAKVVKKVLRPADIISRFESDQFLVLVEDFVDRFAPVSIAERMQSEFDEFLSKAGLKYNIKIEIGILYCTPGYETADEVLQDAQLALRMAKKDKRGGYRIFKRDTSPLQAGRIRSLVGV